MTEPAMRVALLARPGTACDRLQAALREVGAEPVLVLDPTTGDCGTLQGAAPGAVLVALEPAVEEVLERFEAVLDDPAVTVVFDEAELAASREGWDAARWTRHLAAKLNRHDDVLPPGREESEPAFTFHGEPQRPDLYQRPDVDHDLDAIPLDFGIVSGPGSDAMQSGADASMPSAPKQEEVLDLESWLGKVALENVEVPEADDAASSDRFRMDLDDIQVRTATLDLPQDRIEPEVGPQSGAVIVIAGVGGPDAVRQLLAAVPPRFPRPLLVRQRLDGGRHDRLVRQMQRATEMPVALAQPGEALEPGRVYIVPDAIAAALDGDVIRFVAMEPGQAIPVLLGLPAADSAILVLSGSDPALIDEVMAQALRGALVAGQSPDGCFDGEAAVALVARGGESGSPRELARRLSTRWLSLS